MPQAISSLAQLRSAPATYSRPRRPRLLVRRRVLASGLPAPARSPPSASAAPTRSPRPPVGRLRALGRLDLDERLDPEAVLAEEPDPLAVGKVELGRLVRARRRSGACRSTAASARRSIRSPSSLQQQIDERRRVREREAARPAAAAAPPPARSGTGRRRSSPPWSQKTTSKLASGSGTSSAPAWTSGKSTPAAAMCSRACSSWRAELSSPTTRAPRPREQDRPLRRAAAELEHVLAGDVAEDPELRVRQLPHAPARLVLPPDELARSAPGTRR